MGKIKFSAVITNGMVHYRLSFSDNMPDFGTVYTNFTNNCQLYCIASFCNILAYGGKTTDEYRGYFGIKDLTFANILYQYLNSIKTNITTKALCLIDVNNDYVKYLFEKNGGCFNKEEVLLNQKYNSTSGNTMCICILNVHDMLIRNKSKYE